MSHFNTFILLPTLIIGLARALQCSDHSVFTILNADKDFKISLFFASFPCLSPEVSLSSVISASASSYFLLISKSALFIAYPLRIPSASKQAPLGKIFKDKKNEIQFYLLLRSHFSFLFLLFILSSPCLSCKLDPVLCFVPINGIILLTPDSIVLLLGFTFTDFLPNVFGFMLVAMFDSELYYRQKYFTFET